MLKLITIATLLFPYPLATLAGQDEVRTTEKTYRLRMTEGLPSRMYPCYPYRYCQTFEVPETVVELPDMAPLPTPRPCYPSDNCPVAKNDEPGRDIR